MQASDLKVTFMQNVYSEAVLNTRHDVWDIHTDKDRWWVITGATNLYSQQQFVFGLGLQNTTLIREPVRHTWLPRA